MVTSLQGPGLPFGSWVGIRLRVIRLALVAGGHRVRRLRRLGLRIGFSSVARGVLDDVLEEHHIIVKLVEYFVVQVLLQVQRAALFVSQRGREDANNLSMAVQRTSANRTS